MDNSRRITIYTRDRSTLTPRQRRRIAHRAHAADAVISRKLRRQARRYLLMVARMRRREIRNPFFVRNDND